MKTITRKAVLLLSLLAGIIPVSALADSTSSSFTLETVRSEDGFITREPTVSSYQLKESLADADRYLVQKTVSLEKSVSDHRDASNNLVVAAIMPGGMLYLAYHKTQLITAEGELESVQQEKLELQKDLSRLELDTPVVIQIARFP